MKVIMMTFILSLSVKAGAEIVLLKSDQQIENLKNCHSELLNPNSGADMYKISCSGKIPVQLNHIVKEKNITWKLFGSNDPDFSEQWSMDVANVESYWAKMKTSSLNPLIAIIDTGIDFAHEDLQKSIAYNFQEIPGNGIDDDQNGYTDDYIGWNALANNPFPLDDHFHGTAISGIINAKINNQLGIAGLVLQNSIVPVKFLSPKGGNTDIAIKAIDYAIARKVKIINASWGGPKPSPLLEEMLKRCQMLGILVIVAAGNENSDNDQVATYPANYELDNVISVASLNWRGELADHSNYGRHHVDIAAPGESVMATVPNNRYGYMTGTSYAGPHIAAAASMIWSQNPSLSYLEVKNYLLSRCHKNLSLEGKISCGGYLDFGNF